MMSSTARVHSVNTPLGRFGVETLRDGLGPYIARMPVAGLLNPLTGHPTLGPLAVLVDYVGGMVNHNRRGDDEWTVSSELALDLVPDALAIVSRGPQTPVMAIAHPCGAKGATALGSCELTHGDSVIATGSVRSLYIPRPPAFDDPHDERPAVAGTRPADLVAMMGLRVGDAGQAVLFQSANPALNNDLGIVHGGVASVGLELAAAAALNADRDEPLATGSLRVSFARRLLCGADSRYVGTVVRAGRRSAQAEARAIGADGEIALTAQLTAYR